MPKRDTGAPRPSPPPEPAGDVTEPQDEAIETEEAELAIPEDEELTGLEESDADETFFGVWYGVPGSTKTTSLARVLLARPTGKLIVCNAEGGLKVRALRQWGIPTDRIVVWPKPGIRPTFDGLERLILQVESQLAEARRLGQPKPYCGFGMDSITELNKLMVGNVLEDAIAGQREIDRRARIAGVQPPRRNQRARFKAERDDYGLVAEQMRSILRKLRYLGVDVLITALVRRDEDDDTGATMYGPALNPALQADLLGFADVVIRTERRTNAAGREEIVGYTRPDENHHAKDRFGLLPPEILEPGADRVLELLSGEAVVDSADEPTTEAPETADVDEPEPPATEEKEEPAKPPARRGRKTAAAGKTGGARIDARTMQAVGPGDGSADEPPF